MGDLEAYIRDLYIYKVEINDKQTLVFFMRGFKGWNKKFGENVWTKSITSTRKYLILWKIPLKPFQTLFTKQPNNPTQNYLPPNIIQSTIYIDLK
jgi:hypothetical protein